MLQLVLGFGKASERSGGTSGPGVLWEIPLYDALCCVQTQMLVADRPGPSLTITECADPAAVRLSEERLSSVSKHTSPPVHRSPAPQIYCLWAPWLGIIITLRCV